jgi:hypothetical protein
LVEDSGAVGCDLQACADFSEFGGAFEEPDFETEAGKRLGTRKTSNSASHDDWWPEID